MPNWVKTHMTIYSQEEKGLHQFAELLESCPNLAFKISFKGERELLWRNVFSKSNAVYGHGNGVMTNDKREWF